MEETFTFLKQLPVNFLATVKRDDDGAILPTCRPFGDPVLFDGKIYMLTSAHKSVAEQLAEDNHVCIVAYDGRDGKNSETWLRVDAEAIDDSENIEAKKAIIAEFDWAEEAGYTLDNPEFKCYYLANAQAEVRDSEGEVLASYQF